MTSRAVILPDTGDPFVLSLWLQMFERWRGEIDRLYIIINSPIGQSVERSINKRLEKTFPNSNFYLEYYPDYCDHGEAINKVLDRVKEKHVMLIENDALVFKPGRVDSCFKSLERGECTIVGSDRGSATASLIDAAKRRFGLNERNHGEWFPFFWPNFFFIETQKLRDTDRKFGSHVWKQGEYIKELDWTTPEECVGDTFVWTSLQLMAENPIIKYVEQYHSYVEDPFFEREGKHLWSNNCKWLHFGSVSTGMSSVLCDDRGVPLARIEEGNSRTTFINGHYQDHVNEHNRAEYERRCAYWLMAWETQHHHFPELSFEYHKAIMRFISYFSLDSYRIAESIRMYKSLLGI